MQATTLQFLLYMILQNISPVGTAPGTVIASPQRSEPDYYFHWVRDAALTMHTVLNAYERSGESQELQRRFADYISLSRAQQDAATYTGLGEPKFNADGTPFYLGWCRPQTDGPALRAITMIAYASRPGRHNLGPAAEIARADLDYVVQNWRMPTCDLWEEVIGHHFYTRMVQRRALLDGARLFMNLGEPEYARRYQQAAKDLEPEILKHWDESRGYFVATLDTISGPKKESGLDAAVILGVLHGHTDDGFLDYNDPRVVKTAEALAQHFKSQYRINQRADIPGIGIGRYPEDVYAGKDFSGGNPWFLLTAAFSRYYSLAGLDAQADAQLARVRFHSATDGRMDEQFSRNDGYMVSARDLTWSYAETLEAEWARATRREALQPTLQP